jgi:hypothetical protein
VERRNGLALARAARGAAWRRAKSRVHAYGIVRVPVDDATPAEARRLANDWCQAA